jgi:hypothetical protein
VDRIKRVAAYLKMKRTVLAMNKSTSKAEVSASRPIDARIKELPDWGGEMLARVRKLIHQACPDVV